MFTLTMELRAAAVLFLLLCVVIITAQGFIPKCCVETSATINSKILKKAQKYDLQSDTGPCELKALVLHVGQQRFCLDPKIEKRVRKEMKKMKKKKKHGHVYKQKKTLITFS